MNKTVEYFSHDANANQDPKMMLLLSQLGAEGYGIYWLILEYLAQQTGYKAPLLMLEPLSRRFGLSREKFEVVVRNYNLFQIEDDVFYSPSQLRRLDILNKKRELRRTAALKRWEGNANAMQMQCKCNANAMQSKVKKSKGKESKVKENKVKESKEEENSITIHSSPFLNCDEWLTLNGVKVEKNAFDILYWIHKENIFPQRYLPKNKSMELQWLTCLNKLIMIDKYKPDDIRQAIIYARTNDFWRTNFLSLLKLRTKDKHGVLYIDRFLEESKKESLKEKPAADPVYDSMQKIMKILNDETKI